MSHRHKILNIHPANPPLRETLSKALGVSKHLAQLLINRKINNTKEAEQFLQAKLEYLVDPLIFRDMPKAVNLVRKAAKNKEKVLLYGDYDVDGITALAILKNTLQKLGIQPLHYIPHRIKEGYGLNKNIVLQAKEKKIKLLITADCGTSSYEEVKALREIGTEVIITDHHEPSSRNLVQASCLINPKLKNCPYPYKELAGVGVAYKLCQALTEDKLIEDLDLVSLGTIADVVPLTGENRIIAREGLKHLTRAKRLGIKALIEVSRINGKPINAGFVSFILGPRLNASGRMDSAETSLRLLLSRDREEAQELAQSIEAHNRQRQKIESKIMEEAEDLINKEVNFKEHKVIVIAKEGWHQGVLGIVASKLADRFYRPTIVISLSDGLCKGSGRSIANFHLFDALTDCSQFLKSFGGHAHAVGLLLMQENIADFKKEINLLAHHRLKLEDLLPSLEVDMEADLADLTVELAKEISSLEPFGVGNPEPLFLGRNLKLKGTPQVLGRETLKFWVTDGAVIRPVIGFGMSSCLEMLTGSNFLDLIFTPRLDTWQEEEAVILEAKDMFFR